MILKIVMLCAAVAILAAGVVMSQLRAPSKKMDHVTRPQPIEIPNFGDYTYAANNEVRARIPEGFVTRLLAQPQDRREKEFAELFNQPQINYKGWSCIINAIETSGPKVTVTVLVTPRIDAAGVSTTSLGGIEEVYCFENGELTLVSARVKGSPTSYITD